MRKILITLILTTSAALGSVSVATGQDAGPRTSLAVVSGAAFDSADTGPSVGGAMTVDLTSRFAVEGSATYLNRGTGADALNIQAGVLANLVDGGNRVVPFVAAGAGLYRASFDLAAPRFFGGLGARFGPGESLCDGAGVCPYGNMPGFYGSRLGAVSVPPPGTSWPTRTFTDPAFHLSAGARIRLTPHVLVRPEVRGLLVAGNRHALGLGSVSVGLGYLF